MKRRQSRREASWSVSQAGPLCPGLLSPGIPSRHSSVQEPILIDVNLRSSARPFGACLARKRNDAFGTL